MANYGLNQLRYDLRKLKGHGLFERDGSRYAYRLTAKGVDVGLLFLFFHERLCGPLAVIELFTDDLGAEPVGGRLQRRDIVHGQKSVVVLLKADVVPLQFLFCERVTVEPVGGVEGKERCDADDDRSKHPIQDIEVEMSEAAGLMRQVRGIFRHGGAEGAAQFHVFKTK